MLGLFNVVLALTTFTRSESTNIVISGKNEGWTPVKFMVSGSGPVPNAYADARNKLKNMLMFLNVSAATNNSITYKVLKKKNGKYDFDSYKYCSSFKQCEECVQAELFACGWCHHFGCTHRPDLFCPQIKNRLIYYNDSCPYISRKAPIREHVGKIAITLKVRIPDSIVYQHGVICMISIGDSKIFVKGHFTKNIVNCERFQYYDHRNYLGTVQLIWGGAAPLSNVVPLVLYSCASMGRTCSACKGIHRAYDCGWCKGKNKCTPWARCQPNRHGWLTGDQLRCENTNTTNLDNRKGEYE